MTALDPRARAELAARAVALPNRSVDLCGLRIAGLTRHEVVEHVFECLAGGKGGWLLTANVDYLQRFASDLAAARVLAGANLVVADGMPLLWAAGLQGAPLPDRVAGSDLVWLLADRAARDGRSLYLLGGEPGDAEGAAGQFAARSPDLDVAGISSPRVSKNPTDAELEAIRASLSEAAPDLVFVALGAPKEERVIARLRPHFPEVWWVGVGISLGFASRSVPRAPDWMQRLGLEWLHRLGHEPTRLARRYLLVNLPFTLALLLRSLFARGHAL